VGMDLQGEVSSARARASTKQVQVGHTMCVYV
jgi:hypothetical protein